MMREKTPSKKAPKVKAPKVEAMRLSALRLFLKAVGPSFVRPGMLIAFPANVSATTLEQLRLAMKGTRLQFDAEGRRTGATGKREYLYRTGVISDPFYEGRVVG